MARINRAALKKNRNYFPLIKKGLLAGINKPSIYAKQKQTPSFPLIRGRNQSLGVIIFSGRMISSNASASTNPPSIASMRKVVPFLCARLAIIEALS